MMVRLEKWGLLACLLGLLAASGCFKHTAEIYLKKDGSGTVTETTCFTPQAMAMMASMPSKDGKNPVEKLTNIDQATMEARAKELGEGVRFVSGDPVKLPDGAKGQRAIFAFDDINKLKMNFQPKTPASPGMQQPSQQKVDAKPIKFTYDKAKGLLTLQSPQRDEKEIEEAQASMEQSEQSAAMAAQMAPMFQGMEMEFRLKVEGTITETNAQHVNKAKDGITLLRMDIGKIMTDPKKMKRLQKMGQIKDVTLASKMLKDMPEVKVQPEETLTVQFE